MKKVNPVIQWWATPKLPRVHIFVVAGSRPRGTMELYRLYFRKWLIHPIKRRLARYYLKFLQRFFGITIIGITGSAGKTTTKEMIAAILKQKGETVYSFANIDPVYNIPTTILSARPNTRYLILEMGVEYPGEMDFYLWLAEPDIGVITNIYPTHTEFLGSEEGVYKEKSKLVKNLSEKGFAVLNSENRFTPKILKETKAKVVLFGQKGEVRANEIEFTKELKTKFTLNFGKDKIGIHLPILGRQFVQNALTAASVAKLLGASSQQIKAGLEKFNSQAHRMRPITLADGTLLVDDSYNNNPQAAAEALKSFREVTEDKKRIIIFGDMLELGNLSKESHKEIGKVIANLNPSRLICVGPASKETCKEAKKRLGKYRVDWLETSKEVFGYLHGLTGKDIAILIKGSRSIGLDKVVDSLVYN